MAQDRHRPSTPQGLAAILGATLRSASELSRHTDLLEATRLVRQALTRKGTPLPMDGFPREMPSLLVDADLGTVVQPDDRAAEDRGKPAPTQRPRHPLGTVLDLLHHPEVAAPAILRERGMPRAAEGAAYLARSYGSAAGSRDYRLYVSAAARKRARGLVVMLHGCTQTPDDFAAGTGMNRIAEEHGLVIAYPWQSSRANQSGCWNWFKPEDQARDRGEPSILAGLTRDLVDELEIEPTRVFVAGLSAGGAMAAILAATYPELFHAAGIHSGLAYGAANDLVSAFAAMRGTPVPTAPGQRRAASPPKGFTRTIVFHGTADTTVHPSNGEAIFATAQARLTGVAETRQRGRSDGGLAYTRKFVTDSRGHPQLEHWTIEGLGHAWSGGLPDGSYTDIAGPDASREMVRFFLST